MKELLCTLPLRPTPFLPPPSLPPPPQTTKIDVYSFGVLVCEVVTGVFPESDKFRDLLGHVRRMWPQIHPLITSCISHSAQDRPAWTTSSHKSNKWTGNLFDLCSREYFITKHLTFSLMHGTPGYIFVYLLAAQIVHCVFIVDDLYQECIHKIQ